MMVSSDDKKDRESPLSLGMTSQGDTVRLVDIRGGIGLQHRLAEMGLTPDVKFEIVSNNRGGPCVVLLKGTRMMIGRGMIDRIFVVRN